MVTTVEQWGNSLAIRLPQHLAKDIALSEGTQIEFLVIDGSLVIKPRHRKRYSLAQLVEQMTPESLHQEVDGLR